MANLNLEQMRLSDLIAFDQQLQSYVKAGMQLQWEVGSPVATTLHQSTETVKNLAVIINQGVSFSKEFLTSKLISDAYRLSFLCWFVLDRDARAFELIQDIRLRVPSIKARWAWVAQFWIVAILGLAVAYLWSHVGLRVLVNLYQESHLRPGMALSAWLWFSSRFSWLGFVPPLIVAVSVVAFFIFIVMQLLDLQPLARFGTFRERNLRSLGRSNIRQLQMAQFIELLMSNGVSFADAQSLFQKASGDGWTAPIGETESGVDEDDGLFHLAKIQAAESELSNRLAVRLRNRPMIHFSIFGGLIVLMVALFLILPVVEFMYALSVQGRF